jgi:hypothetical protein
LAGLYVVVVAVGAFLLPHEWDWHVLQWLGGRVAPAFSRDVTIVDVDWSPSDIASDRRRIADFLNGLVRSNQRPNAVILDVEFYPCQSNPCGAPMDSARSALIASIRAASQRFPVYATEEPRVDRNDEVIGPLDPRDERIYSAVSGAAQSTFTSIPNAGGLFYRICYSGVPFVDAVGNRQGTENVWAMAVRALMAPRDFAAAPVCDGTHVPLRLGSPVQQRSENVYPFTSARTFTKYSQFDDKTLVIVGTMKYDRPPFTDRSGPELLGWALSNALDQGEITGKNAYYDVQPQNQLLIFFVPFFSGVAVLAYVAGFYQLKRTRLGALRSLSPWMAAAMAAVAGLAVFAVFETSLFFSHHIQPQVSLTVLGIVLASGLSGVRGLQILATESAAIDAAPTETYDYDVFISYARDERQWVHENVYLPLRNAALPDGRRLSVFFDTASIRSGTAWQTKLSLAIDNSRFIVPVYSEAYFLRPYCRFEILRAHRKWIREGETSRCVLPVMRGHPKILQAVDDIQARSIDDWPDLVQQHIAEILDRLWRERMAANRAPKDVAR